MEVSVVIICVFASTFVLDGFSKFGIWRLQFKGIKFRYMILEVIDRWIEKTLCNAEISKVSQTVSALFAIESSDVKRFHVFPLFRTSKISPNFHCISSKVPGSWVKFLIVPQNA